VPLDEVGGTVAKNTLKPGRIVLKAVLSSFNKPETASLPLLV
jgi:hypothetical protein